MGSGASKVLRPLSGRPLLLHSLSAFEEAVESLVVAVATRPEDLELVRSLVPAATVVPGGATRQESVERGVAALPAGIEVILVHDAARPLVTPDLVRRVLDAARRDGAAAPLTPLTDTVHRLDGDRVVETIDRRSLAGAQTPQAVRAELLRSALARARREGFDGTDEVSILRRAGVAVTAVPGERWNLKVTVPDDFEWAERILAGRAVRGRT
jgi:2-C-methyl-D-erythritol 4-phosphate cytidylyltransferase